MKIATVLFNRTDTKQAFKEALRARMYTAGYLPHQVSEIFDNWFAPKTLIAYITGTDDAERAADVANEIRGVMCKLRNA